MVRLPLVCVLHVCKNQTYDVVILQRYYSFKCNSVRRHHFYLCLYGLVDIIAKRSEVKVCLDEMYDRLLAGDGSEQVDGWRGCTYEEQLIRLQLLAQRLG
jgi:hypothetical protein